jgi:hypothetical protein
MLWMLWTVLSLAGGGGNAWKAKPFFQPRANLRAVSVNGNSTAQAVLGAQGGVSYWQRDGLLAGRTRLSGEGMYGFAGSAGADVRLGSFIGPHVGIFSYMLGPDVWFNGYGGPDSRDYYLPWSPGVDISNTLRLQFVDQFGLVGVAAPGWVFNKDRQGGGVGPFHEFTLMAGANIRLGGPGVLIGYQRIYNRAGVTDGLVLSASL